MDPKLLELEKRIEDLEKHKVDRLVLPPVQNIITQTVFKRIFGGGVASNGSVTHAIFPNSWSATKDATGEYTITHNLGTTEYVPIATCLEITSTPRIFNFETVGANTFTVTTWADDGTAADAAFWFLVLVF